MLLKKYFLILFLEIIFLFCLFILIPSLLIKERIYDEAVPSNTLIQLEDNKTYSLPFIASHDNLRTVSILMKNPLIKNNTPLILSLESDRNTIQTLNFSGSNVLDPGWINLKFNPIPDSKNKTFTLNLTLQANPNFPIYIYQDDQKNIAYKAAYSSGHFLNALQDNYHIQLSNFQQKHTISLLMYVFLIAFIPLLISL